MNDCCLVPCGRLHSSIQPLQIPFQPDKLKERILGVIYGNACGDAIGLLTEFLSTEEAIKNYGGNESLEYDQKIRDNHRKGWKTGDWTDDTDQMILIMRSIMEQEGKVSALDFGTRLKEWAQKGFPELGDVGGTGIGSTTTFVLIHSIFETNPHAAAYDIWNKSGRDNAPNGGLMRTSILGVYQFQSLDQVKKNTLEICRVTHADPRCEASTVAMTTAIALMLQGGSVIKKDGTVDVDLVIKTSYKTAKKYLKRSKRKELKTYMYATDISTLKLGEPEKIGYVYKCLGAGFWAFKQNDFRKAIQEIIMLGGDADTNAAVAGALLGCKLGVQCIPPSWLNNLLHKGWLDGIIERFLPMVDPSLKSKDTTQEVGTAE